MWMCTNSRLYFIVYCFCNYSTSAAIRMMRMVDFVFISVALYTNHEMSVLLALAHTFTD